jgi:hypothetical protein
MSGGGGSSDVEYTQSPEQQAIMQAALPLYQGMADYGQQRYFGEGVQQMGAPSMSGVLTGQQMYDIPGYDIPNPATAMPTADWWSSLAPQVKAGLYAPYVEAGQGLMQSLSRGGQLGSPTAGYSGATGVAMGELAGQAAQNVGLNAWQMTSPMAMNAWNADLNRNQNMWNAELTRNVSGYQSGQQERMGDYQTQMDVWNRPMQTMGMMGMGMPQAYAQPQSNQWGGALSGGMMGGMAGYQMGGSAGYGALGAGLGALAGYYA